MPIQSTINSNKFLLDLNSGRGHFTIGAFDKEITVDGDVYIDSGHYNLESLELINIKFNGRVWFENVNLGEGLILNNCYVEKGLRLFQCKALFRTFASIERENVSLAIYGGNYSSINLKDSILPYGVIFKGFDDENLKIGHFESLSIHSENGGFYMEFVSVVSKFDVTGGILKNAGIRLHNCEIEASIKINSLKTNSISFTGHSSTFHEDLRIWSGSSTSVTFNNGTFKGEIEITAVQGIDILTVFGSTFEDKVIFRRKDSNGQVINMSLPNEIYVQDCSFNNGFEFNGDKFKGNKLQINFSEKSSGVIDFQHAFFQEVILKGNNYNNSVFLRDCSYDELNFHQLFNRSLISLNNNNPNLNDGQPKKLSIENSNLGNTEFYDFDFSIYPKIRVVDSRLDNIFVNGIETFDPITLNQDEEEIDERKKLTQKREIYRQLKLAAEKQSDRVTALRFKAREIEAHNNLLNSYKPLTIEWFHYIGDIISIKLGDTNEHGQNWIKPVVLLLVITTIPFYPLIFMAADPEIFFWCQDCDLISPRTFFKKFWHYGSVWPSLFNPARRLNDLFLEVDISFALGFWDGLQRIVLAFFIFQIISAFRKFVK